ncbi:Predicted exporter protein, RND superfamily [Butyrivibrio sp. ob235]|uniref:MMPL family transporter n=1 Tax=Butyrivibrio sp. ob235 TaxID=1761780 RepID=UPI0008C0BBC0|nr:MMPL family transporter [Butyrivibrio sp. ob235]SEK83043.1 Predicted exporter protein, RND superfamily [Butyrivibrio sp. ob235]
MAKQGEVRSKASVQKEDDNVMIKVATFIVDRRNLFFLIFGIVLIFCAIASGMVKVENALSAYLPDSFETSIGLDLMEKEFTTYGSAKIMVSNIVYEDAEKLAEDIRARGDVSMLQFDETPDHYNNFSALFDVTFKYEEKDERALQGLEEIKEMLSSYDIFVSTTMGNASAETIAKEMKTVSALVVVIVLVVLVLTSQTYAEIPVLLLTFGAAAVMSAGTNFILGTISFVSDSVTIVLQLALSIDYAVIFCNRYKEEHENLPIREADIIALSKAIPEISSSSLTTIGGLVAMMFMQFGIGRDMAICLIKAIVLSLVAVFLLMPGLIMIFGSLMDKTRHKSFVPKIPFVGKFDFFTRFIVPPIFLVLIIGAFIVQNKCPFVYGYSKVETPIKNETQIASELISETFGDSNMVAVVVPAGNYDKEKRLIQTYLKCEEVKSAQGLANIEAMGGYCLADKLTVREFSELLELDYEVAELLYMAYAVNDKNYAKLVNGLSTYRVPLIDMIMFLHDEVDEGYVTLDESMQEKLDDAYEQMNIVKKQLQGENYSRILVYLNLPQEGEETFNFLNSMHTMANNFYEGQILVIGEATSQFDLQKTFSVDNTVVTVISILAVLVVLLFTFKSAGMPVLLILVIEGAIWINFAFPTIENNNIFFMTYLIVSSIQMGANIDYAIVISGRFMELKDKMSHKDAIIETMNFAFPTIITSGSMLALAGFAIGQLTSDGAICGIGQCLGRGTVISIILVMFVLPQILLIGASIIDKTSFAVTLPLTMERDTGLMRVDGIIEGQINGTVIGEMHAVVRGDVRAFIQSGNLERLDATRITAEDLEKLLEGRDAVNEEENA